MTINESRPSSGFSYVNEKWMILLSEWNIICNKENDDNLELTACILSYYIGSKYIKDHLKLRINQKIKNTSLSIFKSDDNSHE